MSEAGIVRASVLIADRHRAVAESLVAVLEGIGTAHVSNCVTTASEALDVTRKAAPDIALVDLELSPDCALVTGMKATSPGTRIIVMADSRNHQADSLLKALEAGAVGALYKGASINEFGRALTASSDGSPFMPSDAAGLLLSSYVDSMREKRRRDVATIEALAGAVEVRDLTTGKHLHRVTGLAGECLKRIDADLANNEDVAFGFMLHDVGKIGVPDAILQKPGPLTDHEWVVMRQHPDMGVRIVEPMGFSENAVDIIRSHHERWDGTGYPNRLKRDEIQIASRAFSVVDAYDAMTSERPYSPPIPPKEALATIADLAGAAYDPDVVDVFIALIEEQGRIEAAA